MPTPIDLTTVIEDAVSDATLPEDTSTDLSTSSDLPETGTQLEASAEGLEGSTNDSASTEGVETAVTEETPVAGLESQPEAVDPNGPAFAMDKKLGIPSHTNGRENRIPYSRVKKIVEGAEKKAVEPLQKQLAELQPKIQDYEQRLQNVATFEQVMVNEPERFFDEILSKIPAYQPFFQRLAELVNFQAQSVTQQPQAQAQSNDDPMPGPDEDDGQGGKIYSMDGLNKLLEWQRRQAKKEVLADVESKYEPLRRQYEAQQRLNQLVPHVEAQIKEARTWEKFNENENEIVAFLQANPNASLETAYRIVVLPKLRIDREAMRKQVLGELQKAPVASTSVSARPQRNVETGVSSGPRSMEDIIRDQIRAAGLK